jgi:hypothetical protein
MKCKRPLAFAATLILTLAASAHAQGISDDKVRS